MRSTQRDRDGTITFGAFITDAPSGSGVAQPGAIPFTFTRTGAGVYAYSVSPGLRVLFGVSNPVGVFNGGSTIDSIPATGAFRVLTFAAGALSSAPNHEWTVTALDKRT